MNFILSLLFPQPISTEILSSLPQSNLGEDLPLKALFTYNNPKTKLLIRYLKRHNDSSLALALANMMNHHLHSYIQEQRRDGYYHHPLIIPVPVSQKTRASRGFNQVEGLARNLAKLLKGTCINRTVVIKKETRKQALLSKEERMNNIVNAFEIRNEKIMKDADCIIVDDLITTGMTSNELTRILKEAGARNVIAISIAH